MQLGLLRFLQPSRALQMCCPAGSTAHAVVPAAWGSQSLQACLARLSRGALAKKHSQQLGCEGHTGVQGSSDGGHTACSGQ